MNFLNTLNRVVIVIVCLLLIAGLTALFLLPQIVLEGLGRWMLDWGNYFYGLDPWVRLGIGVILAIVVDLVLLLVIFFEVRRSRNRFIRVQQVAGGMANISIESVVELLQHRLDPLPGVIEVTPRIQAKGNRVSARVEAGVNRGTNVPQTANQLIKTIQSVLTDELGLQIAGQPEVQVTVVRRKGEGAPAIPAGEAAPPPPTATFRPPSAGPTPAGPPPLPEAASTEVADMEIVAPEPAGDEDEASGTS
ncbi:MAG: alkaline shock response membrane anchor protein AmaP [Anaerolineae bacterium]|nr:alkaline shock response membrane anchor protein AmaP [Anaerolineae bacterium]